MELPLFPLHTVLCPGVALPLHIFEERYRRMVDRCVDAGEPFGVVLIREGRETGPLDGRISRIGTTAIIRDAGRYPDGRFDLMTVGGRRFRIETLTDSQEPYLIADVRYLREPVGDPDMARTLAERVSARFLRYLEVLQPALEDDDDDAEYEVEVIVDDDPEDTRRLRLSRRPRCPVARAAATATLRAAPRTAVRVVEAAPTTRHRTASSPEPRQTARAAHGGRAAPRGARGPDRHLVRPLRAHPGRAAVPATAAGGRHHRAAPASPRGPSSVARSTSSTAI